MVAPLTHPVLPCGYNADDNNGDEVDGSGTNWPIWTVLFDTFEGLIPLIVTSEMLELFVTTCADIVFPAEDDTITFPAEVRGLTIRPEQQQVDVAAEVDDLVLPAEVQEQVIRKAG